LGTLHHHSGRASLSPLTAKEAQERHGPVGGGPEEGYQNDQRDGAPLL